VEQVVYRNALQQGFKIHWYRIERVLGQGGFGITYLAFDPNLQQHVAIKEYLPSEFASRTSDWSVHPLTDDHADHFNWGLGRFINEGQTLARFKHHNIVQVFSIFEANHTAYMVMAYERGESLQEMLARRKTLPEAELLGIVLPILDGLEKVHKTGFIHRDIKPANIVIREDGSPVLLDFGSARQALGQETKTLTAMVSPGYAPFEQYYSKSDKQGPWSDIYGLGATMYRAVVGTVPTASVDRSHAYLKASKDVLYPALKAAKGKYSVPFLRAIDHALQFKEEERPQTVSEWRKELTVKAPQERNGRLLMFAASAFVILLVVAGVGLYWKQYRTEQTKQVKISHVAEEAQAKAKAAEEAKRAEAARVAEEEKKKAGEERKKAEQIAQAQAQAEAAEKQKQAEGERKKAEQARLAQELAQRQQAEQQKQKLADLLKQAGVDLAAGRLTTPENGNAVSHYREVLNLDAGNAEAQKGLHEVARRLAAQAQQSQQAKDYDKAGKLLALALQISPQDQLVLDQQKRLDDEQKKSEEEQNKTKTTTDLLQKADADLKAMRLTSPPKNNALERYQAVLKDDPANARAKDGMQAVADKYVELAKQATAAKQYDKAENYLKQAEGITPDAENIKLASEALNTQRQQTQQPASTAQVSSSDAKPEAQPTLATTLTVANEFISANGSHSTTTQTKPATATATQSAEQKTPVASEKADSEVRAANTPSPPPQGSADYSGIGSLKTITLKLTGFDNELASFNVDEASYRQQITDKLTQAGISVVSEENVIKSQEGGQLELKITYIALPGAWINWSVTLKLRGLRSINQRSKQSLYESELNRPGFSGELRV
jgi:tetratricopeptide (TPR) repeat protein